MNKITVIHHSADFDGLFCREIAHKFLPAAELIGWNFGDAPLDLSLLHSRRLVILDLPVDRVFGLQFKDGWICKGDEQVQPIDRWDSSTVTWIDHHKSSIESHPKDIPGYRLDGVAACRLAWQWFVNGWGRTPEFSQDPCQHLPEKEHYINREICEPPAVRLAGEYDVWDKRDLDAEVFQFGLRSRELTKADWASLLSYDSHASIEEIESLVGAGHRDLLRADGTNRNPIVIGLLKNGELLQRYQQQTDADVVQHRSFLVNWEGLKFLALTTARCNSLTFAAKDMPETGHDALMGFYFNGKAWTVSLYHAKHRTDLDLSQIAVKYGGGGHRGACGFQVTDIAKVISPTH